MLKILVPEPDYFPTEALDLLGQIGEVKAKKITEKEFLQEMAGADILIIRVGTNVDKNLLASAKKLKIIGTATAGLDHIDIAEAKKRGIMIISLDGANTQPTAEYTFALILSLSRKIPWAFEHLKAGLWERPEFFGPELNGKVLGIIGFGRIGQKVAGYGKAFGMKVLAFDPYIDKESFLSAGATAIGLQELLEKSDFITIHSLLTRETENMIGKKQFEKMKSASFFINVSRGKIVDEADLLEALVNKKIAGAALDVYVSEPPDPESGLVRYAKENKNLLITPHIAALTEESVRAAALEIAEKVKRASGSL